jgi:hypothetical protein
MITINQLYREIKVAERKLYPYSIYFIFLSYEKIVSSACKKGIFLTADDNILYYFIIKLVYFANINRYLIGLLSPNDGN